MTMGSRFLCGNVLECYRNHVELSNRYLARESMQDYRQISLIGLRGCFPVVRCGNTAMPGDLPVFLFL